MRKILFTLLCAFSALFFLPNAVTAEVLFSESFDSREDGTLAKDTWSSGSIAKDNCWHTYSAGTYRTSVVKSQLTYTNYNSVVAGKSVNYTANHGKENILFKNVHTLSAGNKVYMAFLLKVTTLKTGAGPESYSNASNALMALRINDNNTANGSLHNRVLIRTASSSSYNLGVVRVGETPSSANFSSVSLSTENTYLVVAEYNCISGDKNDVVNLYINPTKATQTIAVSSTNSATASNDATQFAGLALWTSGNTPSDALIDEIKVATSWDDLWEDGGDTPEPEPEPDPITPPSPVASSITLTSANIAWDAVEDADSYVLQWKVNGGSYSDDIDIDKDVRSYSMSGLESETKYYVRVKTIVGEDASEWATINFNTSSEPDMLVYKGISFEKYSTQDAMPTSGTVFLAKHVVEYNDVVTLTGNLTLNLHGKQLFMYGGHIVVPSGVTLAIYDDAGTGEINGGYSGSFMDRGIITVKAGGTLIIGEGAVINLDDENENEQVAIHNLGTLKLSGAPVISGNRTDIYLGSTVITIESGKPLTNATPYKVYKTTGSSFTSGWANMSGESPKDYFSSTNVGNGGVCLNASGEAQIVPALNLSEDSNNPSIASNNGQLVNASFTRSLTSSQYNTFCLPFALSNAQLEEVFGVGYDLEELIGSSLAGDELTLSFDQVTSLEAGKPYLLQPSVEVTNPSFEGVTIGATAPVDIETSLIDFKGTFNPTELEVGNHNILCLGASNSLFWPNTSNPLKGFRAYFEVKGDAKKAKAARIVKKEDQAQAIDNIENSNPAQKRILNGQLVIEKNGTFYNAQGQIVK